MDRPGNTQQNGPDGDATTGCSLEHVKADIRGIKRRHDQQIRIASESGYGPHL